MACYSVQQRDYLQKVIDSCLLLKDKNLETAAASAAVNNTKKNYSKNVLVLLIA